MNKYKPLKNEENPSKDEPSTSKSLPERSSNFIRESPVYVSCHGRVNPCYKSWDTRSETYRPFNTSKTYWDNSSSSSTSTIYASLSDLKKENEIKEEPNKNKKSTGCFDCIKSNKK